MCIARPRMLVQRNLARTTQPARPDLQTEITSVCVFADLLALIVKTISMSVPKKHTTVMLMLFVTTPWDPITAHAKTDFVEME